MKKMVLGSFTQAEQLQSQTLKLYCLKELLDSIYLYYS